LHDPDANLWQQGTSNEISHLAQGVLSHMPSGTDKFHFVPFSSLPAGRCVVTEYKPHKEEKSVCNLHVVVIMFIILVRSAPKQLMSQLPNSCSTVSSPHLEHVLQLLPSRTSI
jgi:hypothetical protein